MSSEIVNPHHIYCVWICYFKIPWKFVNLGEFEPHHIFVFGCVILKFLESLLILEIELSLLICIPRTCHVSHSLEGSETYKRILLNLHLQITDIFCCYSNVPNFDPYMITECGMESDMKGARLTQFLLKTCEKLSRRFLYILK